jgi:uncharacterized protein YdiU (UPF0061 family)
VGAKTPEKALAQVYAGHQFGMYSPRLGDGRALLLGEVFDAQGRRRDVHLKGSGRTPCARGGDGRAAVGPMLREYLVSEAMHALGIPTTRALAVVATGQDVRRETMLPGAVLARVAASHIRVGTFEYAARNGGLRKLADYAIARHYPGASYLEFYDRVVAAQAALIAQWMHVGFIHGVMNTDNMAISGETIDYGPCAFMDVYDPQTWFSSIDHGGRYAYGNQPAIAAWNLARLGEALLPLLEGDAVEQATAVLSTFDERFKTAWLDGMRAKLGLAAGGEALIQEFLTLLQRHRLDYTSTFRALTGTVPDELTDWAARWRAESPDLAAMDRVNPVYIPRNHLVEDALAAATDDDLGPFNRLLEVLARPFEPRPGLEGYAEPAPPSFGAYQTFCGT